jgi:hypothetical protein
MVAWVREQIALPIAVGVIVGSRSSAHDRRHCKPLMLALLGGVRQDRRSPFRVLVICRAVDAVAWALHRTAAGVGPPDRHCCARI